MENKTKFIIPVCLGCIAAIGPLAIDMYLAALPKISADLGISRGDAQFSLMSFFAGFTCGQLIYGPTSDQFGRKPVIYFALVLFSLASLGCALVSTADQLILFRFAQGLGGAAGMVIALAMVRDMFRGIAGVRLLATVVLVVGVAPILAPTAGSLVLQVSDWRTIFLFLAAFGCLNLALIFLFLPETRPEEKRVSSKLSAVAKNYVRLLFSRDFIPFAGTNAILQGGFFAYIAGVSFVFINDYGLSSMAFSILFGINAVGLISGTQITSRIVGRISPVRIVRVAAIVYTLCGGALLMLKLLGLAHLWAVAALFFVFVTTLGGIMPSCNMLAMERNGAYSGTAASLLGALGFGLGALISAVLGAFSDGSTLALFSIITICGMAGFAIANLYFPKFALPESTES